MSFLKRLGFYLIGLALGLIFLAFFLNRKNAQFCYLPNCRVFKELRAKPLAYTDAAMQELDQLELDSTDILYLLNRGNVDFRASETKAKPCKLYIIEGTSRQKSLELSVENCDSLVTAISIKKLEN